MPRLFVHAVNVHQGGGAVLLCDLLRAIPPDVEAVVHVDARMSVPADLQEHIRIERIEPTVSDRFSAERRLAAKVSPADRVLCFGNLPPLFRLRGEVVVFIQNRYLVDPCAPLGALPLKPRIRLWLERAWLRLCRFNASRYIVQTTSMQRLVAHRLGMPVSCAPFLSSCVLGQVNEPTKRQFDFIYVASGEAHKNHVELISAWAILAEEGLFPSLALTLEQESTPELCALVAQVIAQRGVRIHNLGVVAHESLLEIYRASGALIYPSSFESFGLPLIEAKLIGLPILAPELEYVRDVVVPDFTFDPSSPLSIAGAVKRKLEKGQTTAKFINAKTFIQKIIKEDGI